MVISGSPSSKASLTQVNHRVVISSASHPLPINQIFHKYSSISTGFHDGKSLFQWIAQESRMHDFSSSNTLALQKSNIT
ncbi:unnamed protein product [Rhizophagus irregularis]|nr:unnamed protein product [Rhizophagus irregularis]